MKLGLKIAAATGAFLMAGALADVASAQTRTTSPEEALRLGTPPSATQFKFNERGRWGVDLKLADPVTREQKLRDVEAGAFFRVTPSVRVGGSVQLDDKLKPERPTPDDRGPRIRLETRFKF
jgi:hypothetical protein